MKSLLSAALRLVDRETAHEPEANGFQIECPDGLMVYRDETGAPLPGVEFDEYGTPIAGGEFIPCGRQVVHNGCCPRCGGRSWIPAAPAATSPMDLRTKLEQLRNERTAEAEKTAALIAAKFD
ncbi:MAG TPA: hypothetical protein VF761_17115 [Gemmatimonadaceae bacterium]